MSTFARNLLFLSASHDLPMKPNVKAIDDAVKINGDEKYWLQVERVLGHHWFEAAIKKAIDDAVVAECNARINFAKTHSYIKIDIFESMALFDLRETAQMRLDADQNTSGKL